MKKFRLSFALHLTACLLVLSLIAGIATGKDIVTGNSLWVIFTLAAATVAFHILSFGSQKSTSTSIVASYPEKDAVVLILGPYASKWFGQSGTTKQVRYSDSVTWILIRTPEALEEKLEYFQKQAQKTQVSALFPFLPDGHDNTAQMIEQLAVWRQHSEGASVFPLPCTFALYYRLSERSTTTTDKTEWSGEIDFVQKKRMSFHGALSSLELSLISQPGSTQAQIQRAIFGHQLIAWLKESQLAEHLEQYFSHSSLALNNILLCDYSRGFTRHGAWSRWSEEQFAVLPALGSTAAPLPCAPLKNSKQFVKYTGDIDIPAQKNPPGILWSVVLAAVILGIHMLHTTRWLELQRQAYTASSPTFESGQQRSLTQLNHNLDSLQKSRAQFAQCADFHSIGFWGFSVCTHQLRIIDETIAKLHGLPTMTTEGQSILFASGSAVIDRSAGSTLGQIQVLANSFPKHTFLIVGHTDNSGNEQMNMGLSQQRAVAVRDWLISHNTFAPERFVTHGVGATEPVASNLTPAGREKNRRIEVLVLPSSQPSETIE